MNFVTSTVIKIENISAPLESSLWPVPSAFPRLPTKATAVLTSATSHIP